MNLSKLRRLFRLPTPVEIGISKTNNLGIRGLSKSIIPTWEDYYDRIKKYYSIKYFLFITAPRFFRIKVWRHFVDAVYWLKCHIIKDYKFHLIDLRGIDPVNKYTHGYRDPGDSLELACWAMLRRYVEKCEPSDPATWAEPNEIKVGGDLYHQKMIYDEFMELYNWWMKDRFEYEKEGDKLYKELRKTMNSYDDDLFDQVNKKVAEYRAWVEEQEDERFMRLIKLRKYLWD